MPAEHQDPSSVPSARILVVEDDDPLRLMLRFVLSEAGYDVEEASDGREGVEILGKSSFDLVIVDILMPERDGYELIQELKKMQPQTKILAMSGAAPFGAYKPLETAKIFGAHRVLQKPFEAPTLLTVVWELLNRQSS